MMPARFSSPLLPLALAGGLLAQAPAETQEPEESSAASIPVITRVLVRSEKLVSGSKFWLKNRNGNVRVMGWDKEEMQLTAEVRDTERRRVELVILRKEGDLDIETVFQQPFWSFDWGLVASPRCEMTVFVPKRLLGYFRTTNGTLFVSYVDGYVRCETTNGDITVEEVTGEAYVETKNGAIEARDLEARIHATTTNGPLVFTDVSGGITAETSNGNIIAKHLNGWGEGITLTTVNGSIELSLGEATGEITAESADGSVELKVPDAKILELSKHSARLRIPGRTQRIALRTTNGSITIRE